MHFNFGVYFRSKLDTWKILFGFKSYGQQKNVSKVVKNTFFYSLYNIYTYIYTIIVHPIQTNFCSILYGWAGLGLKSGPKETCIGSATAHLHLNWFSVNK